jgi:dTDP-glucose pyrophosphorylase
MSIPFEAPLIDGGNLGDGYMSKDEIDRFLIAPDVSIVAAMRQLEDSAEKILIVVDEKHRLIGTLTDGDIRRWIIGGGGLENGIGNVCNRDPVTVGPGFNVDRVRKIMSLKRLNCIPVISRKHVVTDLLFWKDLFVDELRKPSCRLNLPVVIMAGGKGARLDPFTRILPKPLIPIGDKSVIEIIIDRFRRYGVSKFIISVNHKARIIKSFFEEMCPDYQVDFIDEEIPLGTAGCLERLRGAIEGPFIVTNCDIIMECDYGELLDFHTSACNEITMVATVKNYVIPYGVCRMEKGGTLQGIDEKPEYNFLVNTGLYCINPAVLDLVPRDEFFHMTHLIEKALDRGLKVGVFPIGEGSWVDIGEWGEYRKAVEMITL